MPQKMWVHLLIEIVAYSYNYKGGTLCVCATGGGGGVIREVV